MNWRLILARLGDVLLTVLYVRYLNATWRQCSWRRYVIQSVYIYDDAEDDAAPADDERAPTTKEATVAVDLILRYIEAQDCTDESDVNMIIKLQQRVSEIAKIKAKQMRVTDFFK